MNNNLTVDLLKMSIWVKINPAEGQNFLFRHVRCFVPPDQFCPPPPIGNMFPCPPKNMKVLGGTVIIGIPLPPNLGGTCPPRPSPWFSLCPLPLSLSLSLCLWHERSWRVLYRRLVPVSRSIEESGNKDVQPSRLHDSQGLATEGTARASSAKPLYLSARPLN